MDASPPLPPRLLLGLALALVSAIPAVLAVPAPARAAARNLGAEVCAAPPVGRSHEWTPGNPAATWAPSALPVTFTPALPLPRALGQETLAELAVAARTWSEVSCTQFRAAIAAPAAIVPADDGINGVFFHEDVWPSTFLPGALGQTVLHTDATGHLHDADIHLNAVDFKWSLGLDPTDGTIDARGVLLHEMGHALGLGHSSDPRATMYASHPPGLVWRSLARDDEDGVCALYPGAGAARCDTGAACPDGFFCVARACERRGQRGEVCSPCARVPGACDGAGDDARCNDLPDAGGRVCGRACAIDAQCGPRFVCAPQTAAGDLQCVPTDGCAGGPVLCARAEDCGSGAKCRAGVCVGDAPEEADGGKDAAPEGGLVLEDAPAARGGCAVANGDRTRGCGAGWAIGVLIFLARLLRRRGGRA